MKAKRKPPHQFGPQPDPRERSAPMVLDEIFRLASEGASAKKQLRLLDLREEFLLLRQENEDAMVEWSTEYDTYKRAANARRKKKTRKKSVVEKAAELEVLFRMRQREVMPPLRTTTSDSAIAFHILKKLKKPKSSLRTIRRIVGKYRKSSPLK